MTTQDLDDQEFGVRCQLHGGPCDGERVAWQAREFAPDRGFSPANIRRRSEIPGVKYMYERTHRDEEGIHHYDLTGRQGWSDCQDYDDVLVVYFGGPLHGQQEWIPLTTSGLPPEPIKIVEGVEYAYNELRGPRKYVYDGSYNPEPAKKNGVYDCQGYVRCRLEGSWNDRLGKTVIGPHVVKEVASQPGRGQKWSPPDYYAEDANLYEGYALFNRIGFDSSAQVHEYRFSRYHEPQPDYRQ